MYRAALLVLAFGLAACAYQASPPGPQPVAPGGPPVSTVPTALGPVLADAHGMTLYTFDNDKPGLSNCYGPCAKAWPPLMAGPGAAPAGPWSVVPRKDGTAMWAYKGEPVYLWQKDKKPGDTTGDGFRGVWHIARP